MRCRCCDSPKTKWWANDYYCQACRDSIRVTIKDMVDNGVQELTVDDGEIESVDSAFDNEEET